MRQSLPLRKGSKKVDRPFALPGQMRLHARPIRFGTDGWRAVIGEQYTFEYLSVVAHAAARYLVRHGGREKGVAVGYDRRFLGERFARHLSEVLAGYGIPVQFSDAYSPTPALAWNVVDRGLAGGFMITASHNPAPFNGVKFKPSFGGSAPEAVTREIETEANRLLVEGLSVPSSGESGSGKDDSDPGYGHSAPIRTFSPKDAYLKALLGLVDVERIGRSGLRVVVDPIHGAAAGYADEALLACGCQVEVIRSEANPGFGGVNPEPIPPNVDALCQRMALGSADVGFALDGDGDRVGIVDEKGRFVNPHQILSLLLMHFVKNRGLRGAAVKTVSTTSMIDRLGELYDIPVFETAVGFKYVCDVMLREDVLIGGEESGGVGVRGHIPERDATLASLLFAELMAYTGLRPGELVNHLFAMVGRHEYDRVDMHLADMSVARRVVELLQKNPPGKIAAQEVKGINTKDGFKYLLADGSWLMIRVSGTEPMVRIYSEAFSPEAVSHRLRWGRSIVESANV